MRTRFSPIPIVLLAAFAVSAAAAASAYAALPEFSNFPMKFTGKHTGNVTFETKGGWLLPCTTGGERSGEITGPKKIEKETLTFVGCKQSGSGLTCTTAGQALGTIQIPGATGELGYLSKASKTVGITTHIPGTVIAHCSGGAELTWELRGSLICKLTPVNTYTTTFQLSCRQSKGVQEFTKFDGGPEEFLATSIAKGTFEQAGQEASDELTTKQSIQILG